jgi:hypothetical protein
VTLNIFDRKFSVNFPSRKNWSTEFVDLVALDQLIFCIDGKAGTGSAKLVPACSLTF